jgi:hypothetical protein
MAATSPEIRPTAGTGRQDSESYSRLCEASTPVARSITLDERAEMPRAVPRCLAAEQQFELAFQGAKIADALVNLAEVLARQLTNPLARRPAVACEL